MFCVIVQEKVSTAWTKYTSLSRVPTVIPRLLTRIVLTVHLWRNSSFTRMVGCIIMFCEAE
ncbi:unnamed protein product [Acanthoscelides obtectus]|uniref:Uncharacterized protein n=1 Tax=Acanthoscelides obtectus TaxID=200917 RepID=A0A9P0JPF8_ACAOB|nr:unnamed protein product [Acanthoscelides obtectus]CAK1667050.1 hypothetical protein AOBTE_LOCUS25643 [Acanthoscelides obtectus]